MAKATNDRTYIWEDTGWPTLAFSMEALAAPLDAARRAQGELLGTLRRLRLDEMKEAAVAAMSREVVANSAIEGVDLSAESVRASILLRLGAEDGGLPPGPSRRTDPIAGVLTEAVQGWDQPLTLERIFAWHQAIFPGGTSPQLGPIPTGAFRGTEPMVVATQSRTYGEPDIIHYEAPGRERLDAEMAAFLTWFNGPSRATDGILRAALAHFWFVTIHPMADGNGRLARTITDLALAQDERNPMRFYSLSAQIIRNRNAYYDALEQAQRGPLDITPWMGWFLDQFQDAARNGIREVFRVAARTRFWEEAQGLGLNDRQIKVLHAALSPFNEHGGLSHNLAKRVLQGISRPTITRDLRNLVVHGLIAPANPSHHHGQGAAYQILLDKFLPRDLQEAVKRLEASLRPDRR